MKKQKLLIAVIGGHQCNAKVEQIAQEIGKKIAEVGAILVCGGLSGVMKAVSKGTKEAGGTTIGILPGENKKDANAYVDIAIPTGLGLARNTLVVRTADIIIALPGKYGTLSEIAFALNAGKTVLGIGTWNIKGVIKVKTPEGALRYINNKFIKKY